MRIRHLPLIIATMMTATSIFAEEIPSILPTPKSFELQKGEFKAAGAVFNSDDSFDEGAKAAISRFANDLSFVCGKSNSFAATTGISTAADAGKAKGFVFCHVPSMTKGEYTIDISSRCVCVRACGKDGVLYAIATLKQMLPVQIYGRKGAPEVKSWTLPCCSIKDNPTFQYRGMHLDCSRHFFSVEEIRRYLDVMAIYKLNYFHWHLTDDQGWRLEIKKYPLLTQIGAYRNGTVIGLERKENDGIRYGGYYTQEQVKEIIAYAEKRGITVIPEIDLPGHMQAALAAYPILGCDGGPYEVWQNWGISKQVLCPGKEATMTFIKDVLEEVADLFPGTYVHIGGDECDKTEWKECAECQALIAGLGLGDDDKYTKEQYLQAYVTDFASNVLRKKGKTVIGWDEVMEGNPDRNTVMMSWLGEEYAAEELARGYYVILTPCHTFYFNRHQEVPVEPFALQVSSLVPVKKVYDFDPYEKIGRQYRAQILGIQACMWSEYVTSDKNLEYQLLPRLMALCEIQWNSADTKPGYDSFRENLLSHQLRIMDLLGYTCSKAILK